MKRSTQRTYCIRTGENNQDCETCSLSSYGRDCRNNPVPSHAEIADEVREYLDTGHLRAGGTGGKVRER